MEGKDERMGGGKLNEDDGKRGIIARKKSILINCQYMCAYKLLQHFPVKQVNEFREAFKTENV